MNLNDIIIALDLKITKIVYFCEKKSLMEHKIAFFIFNHTSVGGVERVVSNLMSLFIKNGYRVDSLISLRDATEKNKMIYFDERIEIKKIAWQHVASEIKSYVTEREITHLIFQGDNMSYAMSILEGLLETNCKGYLHYHGSPYAYLKKHLYWSDVLENPINLIKIGVSKVFHPFKRHKLKKIINSCTDGFITVSSGVKMELNNLYNTTFKNVTAIHNPNSFHVIDEIEINKKERKVVFISRLERKDKNAFLIVKAWELIHHKYPNWEFQVLGNGRLMPRMKTYLKNKNIKNCSLLGHVNNVNDYLKKSSISVLSSDCEGFGMGLFESMAYKNAIVSTKSNGGVVDLVQHGHNGFLVPKNDHREMAKRIEQLILDANLRNKMGNNSLDKYQKIINENVLKQWTTLLKLNRINS